MRLSECQLLVLVFFNHSVHANQASSSDSSSQRTAPNASSLSFNQTRDTPDESTTARDDTAQTQPDQSNLITVAHTSSLEENSSTNHSALGVDIGVVTVSSDIWSAAYREAVDSLGKDIDVAILKGENVAQLFRRLEEIDKEATQDSAFLRGVRYLQTLQVPLETFKLALDLASPLTSMEPTTTVVFGVVKSVTAVSSFHRNLTTLNFCKCNYIGGADSYKNRLLSASQLLTSSSRRKSGKCLSKFPILMTVTRSVRNQTRQIYIR